MHESYGCPCYDGWKNLKRSSSTRTIAKCQLATIGMSSKWMCVRYSDTDQQLHLQFKPSHKSIAAFFLLENCKVRPHLRAISISFWFQVLFSLISKIFCHRWIRGKVRSISCFGRKSLTLWDWLPNMMLSLFHLHQSAEMKLSISLWIQMKSCRILFLGIWQQICWKDSWEMTFRSVKQCLLSLSYQDWESHLYSL